MTEVSSSALFPPALLQKITTRFSILERKHQTPAARGPTTKNITVAVSDRAYHDARVWAARHDTSISKVVQDFLETLPTLADPPTFPLSDWENQAPAAVRTRTLDLMRKLIRETVNQ